jgi:hypothetical protein
LRISLVLQIIFSLLFTLAVALVDTEIEGIKQQIKDFHGFGFSY